MNTYKDHWSNRLDPAFDIFSLNQFSGWFSSILLFSLLLTACEAPGDQPYHKTIYSFGTLVQVELYADDSAHAERAFDLIKQDLDFMHKNWHAWEPGSLGRVNTLLPTGEWFAVSPSMVKLIVRAKEVSLLSEGLFNPAIGQLIAAWGFHRDEPAFDPASQAKIRALVEATPSMNDVEIDGIRLRGANPVVKLDMGAFAKGYGLGIVAEHLHLAGYEDFILNAGGDLVVSGQHVDRPWRVGIRDPGNKTWNKTGNKTVLATVNILPGEGVFTSGDYERFYSEDGVKRHHIIHPVTGLPATGTRAVTVIHSDPGLADAAATALFVAGEKGWARVADRLELEDILLIDDNHTIHMTPSMAARVVFSADQAYELFDEKP